LLFCMKTIYWIMIIPDIKRKGNLQLELWQGRERMSADIKIPSSVCSHRTVFHACSFRVARLYWRVVLPPLWHVGHEKSRSNRSADRCNWNLLEPATFTDSATEHDPADQLQADDTVCWSSGPYRDWRHILASQ
jgi:hypothetical protein